MARRHSRRSSKRHGRRRSHRRRTHRRRQHGGGSCAALPMNREAFGQRGGMAPCVAAGGSDYLMDGAARVQAEVGPLDAAFAELPGVIPSQGGGRRHSRRSSKRHGRRRQSRRRASSRRQRGGMYDITGPSMLLDSAAYAKDGTNPQFHTEGSVNPLYGFNKGAQ
jgi:hypothetical protein